MSVNIECVWQGENILGECPVWNPNNHSLYWVDILNHELHQLNTKTNQHQVTKLGAAPGSFALAENNHLIIALHKRLVLFDCETAEIKPISDAFVEEKFRFNDGKCDPRGRFWVGSIRDMDWFEDESLQGKLYRFDEQKKVDVMDSGFGDSNGMAWRSDHKAMYFIDSLKREVYQYDYDIEVGEASNRRVFIKTDAALGLPDGMTIDAEDCLWVACWQGGCLTRYNPRGELIEKIEIPAISPTSCCFGGENLDTLYVTSARVLANDDELKEKPLAGSLFAFKPGVKGVFEVMYRLTA